MSGRNVTRGRLMLLALAASALAAGEASAHARLLRSDPRAGATVASPVQLRLFFSETVVPAKSTVVLLGAGKAVPLGRLAVDAKDPRAVIVAVPSRLAPGAYKVQWGMTTADTHHTEGDFGFKVR